jgi:phenylalanyl-tRNA synthetase beta chain
MKVSVKWLKDYVDISIPAVDLANKLTMAGNEVASVKNLGANWNNVFVGQLVGINPHPNADRLRLATVDLGKEQHTVVCGAPNLTVGDRICFATVGAELLDGHTGQMSKLKPAKIRGVESKGMVCSEMELGISQNHEGILVLPPDAPLGMPLSEYMGDAVIDLEVTPNRPDCLSVIGIAREAAALTGQKVHIAAITYPESPLPVESKIAVEIQAPDLCPRYCASLITGIKIKPSPKWMQDRLTACGMRPINNIVDISNYVMLEYGQPLHTFDYDKIAGQKIIVRRAGENETFVSLDSVERKLNSRMLVICDAARSVAIAGVMGGANSEVTDQTVNILVEAASFKPTSIYMTGNTLGLPSESRYRFERGISVEMTLPALRRATQLIADLGEGQAARGYIDVYPGRQPVKPVELSAAKLESLLGIKVNMEKITEALEALGIECNVNSAEKLTAIPPYWRSDIKIEADLIEEVSRVIGYDQIPLTLLADPLPHLTPDTIFGLKREISRGLMAEGFHEVLNFSLIGLESLLKLDPDRMPITDLPVRVANPMTADMEYLRTTFRANLLSSFAANRRYETGSIRLFETGKIYVKRAKDLPDERETLCAVFGGLRYAESWQNNDLKLDFFDAKGIAEGLLQRLGLQPVFNKGQDKGLQTNKQTEIYLGQTRVGVMGEVHPKAALAFEITEPVYVLELDLKTLAPLATVSKTYQPVPKFPAIMRDMALILDAGITHQQVQTIVQGFPLVEQVDIFDIYSGEQVGAGKKSMAYRTTYRSRQHTLTDEEVNQVQQKILNRLSSELGAVLRS